MIKVIEIEHLTTLQWTRLLTNKLNNKAIMLIYCRDLCKISTKLDRFVESTQLVLYRNSKSNNNQNQQQSNNFDPINTFFAISWRV